MHQVTDYKWKTVEECNEFWQQAIGRTVYVEFLRCSLDDYTATIDKVTIRQTRRHKYLVFQCGKNCLFEVRLSTKGSVSLTSMYAETPDSIITQEECIRLQPLFEELRLSFLLLAATTIPQDSILWRFRHYYLCDFPTVIYGV